MRYMIDNAFMVEIVHCKVKFFFIHFGLSNYNGVGDAKISIRCEWV